MSLALSATFRTMSLPTRALIFGVAAAVGFLGGYYFIVDQSIFVYNAAISLFMDPSTVKIEPMAMGVGLAFLIGLFHITSI